jgi:hypothetical protein
MPDTPDGLEPAAQNVLKKIGEKNPTLESNTASSIMNVGRTLSISIHADSGSGALAKPHEHGRSPTNIIRYYTTRKLQPDLRSNREVWCHSCK